MHIGSRSFENSLSTSPATGKLFGIAASMGTGYEFDLFSRFVVMPYGMLGYLGGTITMSAPNDTDRKLDISGPLFTAGGIGAYVFSARLRFLLNLGYETVFYANGISGSFFAQLGSSYAF